MTPRYAIDIRALDGTLSGGTENPAMRTAIGALSLLSAAASGYHGYKRNESVGWGFAWFTLGGMFPIFTPVIAVAQGFGKPAKK
jgi:hypothetical protein